jgi:hypothetical protein
MLRKLFFLFIVFMLLISCENKPVHPSLWKIGNHKKKFQKVLDYYDKPEDSLKLKAAKFLIQNMDEHFYYVAKNEDKIDDFFRNVETHISLPILGNQKLYNELRIELVNKYISKSITDGKIKKPRYRKRSDIKTIKPEFLIENIEYAFKAWDFPWAQDYSFDDFCLYILPYRYGHEAPESWRKEFYESYKWVADSVGNTKDPIEVFHYINKYYYNFLTRSNKIYDYGIKLKISNHNMAKVYGDCYEGSGLGVSVLRSLGIPATLINVPKWGDSRFGHEYTGILDSENKWHYFDFGDLKTNDGLIFIGPKMFFKRFDNMKNYQPILEDCTGELIDVIDLEVRIQSDGSDDIYLCVFNNSSWFPIYKGENMKGMVIFKDVGIAPRLYLAAVKSRGKLKPVSEPFSPDSLGNITYFKPNQSKLAKATFYRKYSFRRNKKMSRLKSLIGGKFSVSDERDSKNRKELYEVDTLLQYYNNIIKCSEQKGKYFRYDFPLSLDKNFDGPAEISFYTTLNGTLKKLEGNYFGSPQLSEEHIKLMTDNDLITYVEVWDCQEELEIATSNFVLRKDKKPIWIGLEMDSVSLVTHVGICPRNDKNGIYAGMNYELFYWDDTWKSLGRKVATSDSIGFEEIPENAVLWLRNWDEGIEERIFTMKDGEQVWW